MNKKIQFILNRPQLSENIGMSLRSLGCFGFENLILVNPRNSWPNEKGIRASKHFSDLANKIKTFNSLEGAIAKNEIVIATTVRQRDFVIPQISFKDIERIKAKNICILFGQENNGLNNLELSHANYILTIPTMNGYSLNLSHCISIVAYELSKMFKVSVKDKSHKILKPSSLDIEKFVNFLMKLLNKQGFTTIFTKKLNLEISIRNFLKTSNISQKSLKTAYGILKFITK